MAVWIAKVKCANSPGAWIPCGQGLGLGRDLANLGFSQVGVSAVDIAHHDREVLEPTILAARVLRIRAAFGSNVPNQLDLLFAKAESRDPRIRSEQPGEAVEGIAANASLTFPCE